MGNLSSSSTPHIIKRGINPSTEEPPINLFNQHHTLPIMSPHYLPPVKPSAIALGTIFNHAASLAVLGPVFGDTYHRAQAANSKEEFVKSKEAASAAAAYGTSLVGSAIQSYLF